MVILVIEGKGEFVDGESLRHARVCVCPCLYKVPPPVRTEGDVRAFMHAKRGYRVGAGKREESQTLPRIMIFFLKQGLREMGIFLRAIAR